MQQLKEKGNVNYKIENVNIQKIQHNKNVRGKNQENFRKFQTEKKIRFGERQKREGKLEMNRKIIEEVNASH